MESLTNKLGAATCILVSRGLLLIQAEDSSPSKGEEDTREGDGANPHGETKTVWEIHWPLFLGVLIFIAVAIVVSAICCAFLKVCSKRKHKFKQAEKIVTDEPEMMATCARTHAQKPMLESVLTGDPLPTDEENGWIIPLDQMTPEELDQPEVPLSKV